MRDIEKYTEDYLKEGFEDYMVRYRRRKVLEILERFPHRRILEIGCGMEPLFHYMNADAFTSYIVCEPSKKFYDNALRLAKGKNSIKCVNRPFAAEDEFAENKFDFIICSGILHEVEAPIKLLQEIRKICCQDTVVHINVPNANSFHRLLAKEMGLIKDTTDFSERNIIYQQHSVFDLNSLENLVKSVGFVVIEKDSYFIKPFTHDQMYAMMKHNIIDESVLEGLYMLNNITHGGGKKIGSEIYVNLKINR